jgi:hypothetical protein
MLMMYKLRHGHGKQDEVSWFGPPPPAAACWSAKCAAQPWAAGATAECFFGARRRGVESGPAHYKESAHRHRLQKFIRQAQARNDLIWIKNHPATIRQKYTRWRESEDDMTTEVL